MITLALIPDLARVEPVIERKEATALGPRHAGVERNGLTGSGNEALQDQLLTGRKMAHVLEQSCKIVDPAHIMAARIGLGHNGER